MINSCELVWRKSSYSNGTGGQCVEVAEIPGGSRLVRDSKDRGTGPVLRFAVGEWRAFVADVKAGELD